MRLFKLTFQLFIVLLLVSCSIEPEPIEYGKDACSFCQMNIVDKQHAAQIVTKKGKVFKYDAIECMMRDMKKKDERTIALFVINDYSVPGNFIDAIEATYLVSENIPSPMGANLSGFKNKEIASKTQAEKEGTLYTWDELKTKF
jgi:copper chaperone NosL